MRPGQERLLGFLHRKDDGVPLVLFDVMDSL